MAREKRQNKEESNPAVDLANEISILDLARKEGIEVTYEDRNEARIPDISGYGEIIVNKGSNSWEYTDKENKTTYGNTIRFIARMHEMKWKDAVDFLVEERASYRSNEEYNLTFPIRHSRVQRGNATEQEIGVKTSQGNDQSIVEYAKSIGLTVNDVNDRLATLNEYPGVIIYKKDNNWSARGIKDGDLDMFIQRFHDINEKQVVKNKEQEVSPEIPLDREQNEENRKSEEQSVASEPTINNSKYTKAQLAEIIAGMRHGVDITQFEDIKLNPYQMREIRYALEHGEDLKDFTSYTVPAEYLREVRLAKESGLDISLLALNENKENIFTAEQAREIRLGISHGLQVEQVKIYANEYLDAACMKELRHGLQDGFEKMKDLANGNFNAEDIRTIRTHLIVKKIMDTIQFQLRQLYERILDMFKSRILIEKEQAPQDISISKYARMGDTYSEENLISEATFELNDVAKTLYESMEEEFYQKDFTFEQKKNALKNAVQEMIEKANQIERVSDVELDIALEQAIELVVEETSDQMLKEEALQSMKQEFIDQFFEHENEHNTKLAEFTQGVINERSIPYQDKVDILYQTLGEMYDEQTAKVWIEHLYHPSQVNMEQSNTYNQNLDQLKQLYNILEQTEITEEFVQEIG